MTWSCATPGGANAGHTIVVGGERFALHQLPSGIIRKDVTNVIAAGTVVDPAVLLGEIASLRERGVAIGENLRLSDRAHLVFPYHRREDVLAEGAARQSAKIGTTGRGIGPCYADKAARHWAIRICDLYPAERFRERLAAVIAHKNAYLRGVYGEREILDADRVAAEYLEFARELGSVCLQHHRTPAPPGGDRPAHPVRRRPGQPARPRSRHVPVCHQLQRGRRRRRERCRRARRGDPIDSRRAQGVRYAGRLRAVSDRTA